MTEISTTGGELVFKPRILRPSISAAILLLIGYVSAGAVFYRSGATAGLGLRTILFGLASAGCIGLAGIAIACIIRSLPVLTISPAGVSLRSLFGEKRAGWDSLGPFEVVEIRHGWRWLARSRWARAAILGTDVSRNLVSRRSFYIPDIFRTPVDPVAAALNATGPEGWAGTERSLAALEAASEQIGIAGFRAPWMALALLCVLVLVFIIEAVFAARWWNESPSSLSAKSLLAFGGSNRTFMWGTGEWYRMLTAPMLHGSNAHIVCNGLALVAAGFVLEKLVGRTWFLAIFFVAGIGGSLFSEALNPALATSAGASGAIMGLFAAAFVSSYRLPKGPARATIQAQSCGILIPSLVPLAASELGTIDYGGHIGGAVTGGLIGLLLLKTWPEGARLPGFRRVAATLCVTAALVTVASFGAVAAHSARFTIAFIPEIVLPHSDQDIQASADRLLADYPQDPRSHMYKGLAYAIGHDLPHAETELRIAVSGAQRMRYIFGRQLEYVVGTELAWILLEDGRTSEAKAAASPACNAPASDRPLPPIRKLLADHSLCD